MSDKHANNGSKGSFVILDDPLRGMEDALFAKIRPLFHKNAQLEFMASQASVREWLSRLFINMKLSAQDVRQIVPTLDDHAGKNGQGMQIVSLDMGKAKPEIGVITPGLMDKPGRLELVDLPVEPGHNQELVCLSVNAPVWSVPRNTPVDPNIVLSPTEHKKMVRSFGEREVIRILLETKGGQKPSMEDLPAMFKKKGVFARRFIKHA